MKMKTYIAPTMSEAMDQLRHELGENAILVSTQRLGAGAGVRLTAAIEEVEEDSALKSLTNRNNPLSMKKSAVFLNRTTRPTP